MSTNIKPMTVIFNDHYSPKVLEDPIEYLKKLEEVSGQMSHFLKQIEDKDFECFIVLQFHNECGLSNDFINDSDYVVPCFQQDKYAYNTNRCGTVTGWTYYVPCTPTGVKDVANRDIYRDVNNVPFVIEFRPGSPAYCCRVTLVDPLVA